MYNCTGKFHRFFEQILQLFEQLLLAHTINLYIILIQKFCKTYSLDF